MDELLEQFVVESRELAEEATARLLELEHAPQDAAGIDAVFRALHTLKGGAGIVQFTAMEHAVDAAEDLLGAARAGRRALDAAAIGACLTCLDQVLQWTEEIGTTGRLPDARAQAQAAPLIASLQQFSQDVEVGATSSEPDEGRADPHAVQGRLADPARAVLLAQIALVQHESAAQSAGHLASAVRSAANALRASGFGEPARELMSLAPEEGPPASPAGITRAIEAALQQVGHMPSSTPTAQAVDGMPATGAAHADESGDEITDAAAAGAGGGAAAPRTLRVEASRIDTLVRLTGELIVAKNALAHLARLAAREANPLAAELKSQHASLDHVGAELQRAVLQLRVLPLGVVFRRFPRLLREMSASLGKPVELRLHGEDTEADKAIVEMLFEPLLHVVRNALDHGIEPAAVRASRGKPAIGTLELRAGRQGEHVRIEVIDDGGGLDVARIRDTARARGILAAEVLDSLPDEEVMQLVFAPGFSTASGVTALSGRGVGMDAVRTAVERLGGRVSLHSSPGIGTTVSFLLPFSVMLSTVMSLRAGGQMFGVPLESVVETLRLPASRIAGVGAARAVVVRERTVPVIDLAQMLGGSATRPDASEVTVVIASFAGQLCGLQVDAVGERMEIILKPLEGLLAGTPGIAGTTLTGDGRVLLVLDLAELLQ